MYQCGDILWNANSLSSSMVDNTLQLWHVVGVVGPQKWKRYKGKKKKTTTGLISKIDRDFVTWIKRLNLITYASVALSVELLIHPSMETGSVRWAFGWYWALLIIIHTTNILNKVPDNRPYILICVNSNNNNNKKSTRYICGNLWLFKVQTTSRHSVYEWMSKCKTPTWIFTYG